MCETPSGSNSAVAIRGVQRQADTNAVPCRRLLDLQPECQCAVVIEQYQRSCAESSPDTLFLNSGVVSSFPDGVFRVGKRVRRRPGAGPRGADWNHGDPAPFHGRRHRPAEGDFELRGSIIRPSAPPEERICATTTVRPLIDRTAPLVDVVQPAEGGTLCVSTGAGREMVRVVLHIDDVAFKVEIVDRARSARARDPGCPSSATASTRSARRIPTICPPAGRPCSTRT